MPTYDYHDNNQRRSYGYAPRVPLDEVPESRHAVFFRGLPIHTDPEEVVKIMEDRFGPCKVAFSSRNVEYNVLYLAIRFETKEDARDCKEKYEKSALCGRDVDVTWYRDVRRYYSMLSSSNPNGQSHSYHSSRNYDRERERNYEDKEDNRHHSHRHRSASPSRRHRSTSRSSSDYSSDEESEKYRKEKKSGKKRKSIDKESKGSDDESEKKERKRNKKKSKKRRRSHSPSTERDDKPIKWKVPEEEAEEGECRDNGEREEIDDESGKREKTPDNERTTKDVVENTPEFKKMKMSNGGNEGGDSQDNDIFEMEKVPQSHFKNVAIKINIGGETPPPVSEETVKSVEKKENEKKREEENKSEVVLVSDVKEAIPIEHINCGGKKNESDVDMSETSEVAPCKNDVNSMSIISSIPVESGMSVDSVPIPIPPKVSLPIPTSVDMTSLPKPSPPLSSGISPILGDLLRQLRQISSQVMDSVDVNEGLNLSSLSSINNNQDTVLERASKIEQLSKSSQKWLQDKCGMLKKQFSNDTRTYCLVVSQILNKIPHTIDDMKNGLEEVLHDLESNVLNKFDDLLLQAANMDSL